MVATVGTSTDTTPIAYSFQKKCFYANGRWWDWYYNGANFGWETSLDGIDWTGAFNVYGPYFYIYFDFWYDEANNKICLVRSQGATANIYYRQGTANSDGTITWDSNEVQVTTDKGYYPTVCKDSNGYPWISYRTYSTSYDRVVKATTTNGSSWGSPTTLWTTANSVIAIIPLTGGKMLAVLSRNGAVFQSRLYHDTTWDAAVNASTSFPSYFADFDVIADGDDVHLVFCKVTNFDIVYVKYLYGTGWGSEETVESSTVNQNHPAISFKSTNKVRVYYFLSQTTIKYRDRDTGSWQTAVIISSNESTMTCLSSSYKAVSSKICVTWKSGASSPYNVMFEGYTLEEAIAKSFSDVGAGSDGFLNPYRAMPFSDVGHGAEAFNTPFRSMGFADVGVGADAFIVLLQKAFADVGLGSDVFTKELIGFIEKAFSDSGLGIDSFLIPFKALKFSDVGFGADIFSFLRALGFADSGHGTDAFLIPFKALGFSDVGHGIDSFGILFKGLIFSDSGHATDVFIIPFKALGFSDLGTGVDAFSKWMWEVVLKSFSDVGLGTDIWKGANLIEAPLVIVTVDGKIILRLSRGTKEKPDYISLS